MSDTPEKETLHDTIRRVLAEHQAESSPQGSHGADHKGSGHDVAVFGFCELLGLVFGLPPGEDLYHGAPVTVRLIVFLAIGLFFAVLGPSWPFLRRKYAGVQVMTLSATFARTALDFRYWFVGLIVLYAFTYGPDVYRRAVSAVPPLPPGQHYLIDNGGDDVAFDGRPLGVWWQIALLRIDTSPNPSISGFTVQAKNLGDDEVTLKAAYLVSGIDGSQIPLSVNAYPEGPIHIDEAGPVPPKAPLEFSATFSEQAEASFVKKWGHFFVVIETGTQKIRHEITAEEVRRQIDQAKGPESGPHIVKRKP
jgi:hypothetical protein